MPDHPLGYEFSEACAAHDACYETYGPTKESCDAQFYDDLADACETQSGGAACQALVRLYYMGVDKAGDDAYGEAQVCK